MKELLRHTLVFALGFALLQGAGATVLGKDSGKETNKRIVASRSFRSSNLEGMPVYNLAGEEVGKIEELVINVEQGRIEYAALGVGGFLGIGEKMFAVPWRLFTLNYDETKSFFVLDVSKQVLEKAPGFDKSRWPDVANPKWADDIEKYYSAGPSHNGTFVGFSNDELVMTAEDGKSQHSHPLADDFVVLVKGKRATRSEIHPGDSIRVTTADQDGHTVATRVEVVDSGS